jgi:HD superfamily phosphohydrolase
MVYPGGVHSRFEHVIGTMHVAGLIAESIADEMSLDEDAIQELRLAGLLHDVGHGPFSHLFEEVLSQRTKFSHEDISQRIVLESGIRDILESNGISAKRMSLLCVGKLKEHAYLNEVVAGSLSADIMDYLLRDSYFTGVEYGKVDIHRVIDSLRVMDDHLVLDQAALYAFEAMLIARYEMFKAVYFHRTVRAAELMLARSMSLADEELGLTNLSNIDRYLDLTDEIVVQRLKTLKSRNPKLRLARKLANDYNDRRLVKCVFENVMQRKDRVVEKIFNQKVFRNELVADIAKQSKVDPESIYIDVPTTPSVPYTYAKETLNAITLISEDAEGERTEKVSITELPLVGSIAGFTDVLRVYTIPQHRRAVTKTVHDMFGKGGLTSRISA